MGKKFAIAISFLGVITTGKMGKISSFRVESIFDCVDCCADNIPAENANANMNFLMCLIIKRTI
jgi:hypothetical protein